MWSKCLKWLGLVITTLAGMWSFQSECHVETISEFNFSQNCNWWTVNLYLNTGATTKLCCVSSCVLPKTENCSRILTQCWPQVYCTLVCECSRNLSAVQQAIWSNLRPYLVQILPLYVPKYFWKGLVQKAQLNHKTAQERLEQKALGPKPLSSTLRSLSFECRVYLNKCRTRHEILVQ